MMKSVVQPCAGKPPACVALLASLAATTIAAPTASAAPDCSAAGVASTVSSVTGSANQYLSTHPGANAAVTAAKNEPRPQAETDLRLLHRAPAGVLRLTRYSGPDR